MSLTKERENLTEKTKSEKNSSEKGRNLTKTTLN